MANGGQLCLVPADKISEGLNGTSSFEEKTDSMDAHRIAEYACRFSDKLKLYRLGSLNLGSLKLLRSQRNRVIKAINILEVPFNEIKAFELKEHSSMVEKLQKGSIKGLKASLKNIEKEIKLIINQDPNLKELMRILCSVAGIGKVTACEIIITNRLPTILLTKTLK